MNQLSKTFLLILIVTMVLLGTISYTLIDWDVFNSGTSGLIKEIRLTAIFYLMGLYLIIPYAKKSK